MRKADLGKTAMILRQTVNFGANLVGGFILGVLAVGALQTCRRMCREERLEPRYPSPPKPSTPSPASESSASAAAI
jgi:hypothetical protein